MDKLEVQKRVLLNSDQISLRRMSLNGNPIPLDDFTWCEKTKTFSTLRDNIVVDFRGIDGCTFTTGSGCTFDTGWNCTFKTGSYCTFDTGEDCTFKTGNNCTFTTGSGCTFTTGDGCVIVRKEVCEVIQPTAGETIQLCPYGVSGYLVNGLYNGKPHIIADGVLSKIVDQKGK